ncbi:MAG TPA: hypothetical protein VOA87_19095 [Thermoanaerobaculia bacterium]|nr:hypothetical protein [Thermoanaerobaculia bacterium]
MKPSLVYFRVLAMLLCATCLFVAGCTGTPGPASPSSPAKEPRCNGNHHVSIPVTGHGRAECQTFCNHLKDCYGPRVCGNDPAPRGKPTVVDGTMTVCPCLCVMPASNG